MQQWYFNPTSYFPQMREPVFGSKAPTIPNSPSPALKNPALYPLLSNWLHELDNSVRGTDGHNFSQYITNFSDNQIHRISEITNPDLFSREDLLLVCPGMKLGTANALLTYARDDVKAIQQMHMAAQREFNY